MGLLRHFNLLGLAAECFVETGTENGNGVDHALKYDFFKEIHSVEINEKFYDFCSQKYKHIDRVKLWFGSSEEKMSEILESISGLNSCLFWLDAHLPSDPGSRFLHDREDNNIEFPLEKELQLIKERRDTASDYFLIDDLRIYIDGDFQYPGHTWPHYKEYPGFFPHPEGITFIENLFGETHEFVKIYDHEGYLMLKPKSE